MNKFIINKSKDIFSDFTSIDQNLYKGLYEVEDKTAGIYFLNFGEVTEDIFTKIQYEYISEEFYKHEDALQYNIYLLFITNSLDPALSTKIINDNKYARKLIFDEKEFINYFKLEDSKNEPLPDIVTLWKDKLRSVDLQEVFGTSSFTAAIDNFIENKTIKEIEENKPSVIKNAIKITSVDSISLKDSYRKYPSQREFKFSKVNLINGVNGAGKTSLLESIELLLAGKSFRNKDQDESSESIYGVINKDLKEKFTPKDIDKYRSRDNFWYNRNISKKINSCYQGFNQFNFFNTDAAYEFASSNDKNDIKSAIGKILLGGEYAYIKDRIIGFSDRFKTHFKDISRGIEFNEDKLKKANNSINELGKSSIIPELIKVIQTNIQDLEYIDEKFGRDINDISEIKVDILKLNINQILEEDITNYSEFKIAKDNLSNELKKINELKVDYDNKNLKLISFDKDLTTLQRYYEQLNIFAKYFNISDIEDIAQSKAKLQIAENENYKIKDIKLKLTDFDINNFRKGTNLEEEINFYVSQLNSIEVQLRREERELSVLRNSFSIIEGIINTIKLSGEEYLKNVTHSNSCPLCEQEISYNDLKKKISSTLTKNETQSVLEEKTRNFEKLNKERNLIIERTKQLTNVLSIAEDEKIEYKECLLPEVLSQMNSIIDKEYFISDEITKLKNIEDQLKNINGSVDEFIFLKKEIEKKSDFRIEAKKSKFLIDNEVSKVFNSLNKKRLEKDAVASEINNIVNDFGKYINDDKKNTFDEVIRSYTSRQKALATLDSNFDILKSIIVIHENTSMYDLRKKVETLESNIHRYRLEKNYQSELNKAKMDKKEAEDYLKKNYPKFNRIDNANKVLNDLKNHNGDEVIQKYFDNNIKEIKDIFKTIHSPKEFTDVKFEEGKPLLYKGEMQYSINQISTGQRAALALAIFISLNRKLKNGPNVVLFDDPVTYIDDFNALSFLDFIRYFLVKEGKQIFFATANNKFSTIFKKKFEFLEEDFSEVILER